MARIHWFLCLAACLVALLPPTSAVLITDIFAVQGGNSNGGCDGRIPMLNNWRQECEVSLKKALEAIGLYTETKQGDPNALSSRASMVQDAMKNWFGVKLNSKPRQGKTLPDTVETIQQEIQWIQDFFTLKQTSGGSPLYPPSEFWLHCHSTFLSLKDPAGVAQAYDGTDIKDDKGNDVPISAVPEYANRLKREKGIKPWWGGDHTTLRGYYFDDEGADYCVGTNLGLTAAIQPFRRGADGKAQAGDELASVILCPYSMDTSPRPNSYREASNLLQVGTNLAEAVPKSATLLHEMFHALRGDDYWSGRVERVDLGQCINWTAGNKRKNPENYVFFIAHMTHLFGVADGNQPWSIPNNWDFAIRQDNRIVGAKQPLP